MSEKKRIPPRGGDKVTVKSPREILETLDRAGTLDGLPFMPEMVRYCGRTFVVSKRIERTCEESEKGMRRIRDVVFLEDLRCDGSAHGDCQKGCLIFWKDAWLEKGVTARAAGQPEGSNRDDSLASLSGESPDGSVICQSTELVAATTSLSILEVSSYLRDIRSRTYTPYGLAKTLAYALFLRLRYYLTGTPFRYLEGKQAQTPSGSLDLQPGDWAQVKTRKEIIDTLDKNGMTRGLRFTLDMVPYCGGTYRVLRRLDKMVHEPTRKVISVKDTVILEGSICKGCHILKGGCPRQNYNFWREVWLRPAPPR
jgi:hypothetical protein